MAERAKRKPASLAPKLESDDCDEVHLGRVICDGEGAEVAVSRDAGTIKLGEPAVGKICEPLVTSGGLEGTWAARLRGARSATSVCATSSTACDRDRGRGPRRRQSCGF